jgi:phosphoribosylformylglycinamidine cyclo-ligase
LYKKGRNIMEKSYSESYKAAGVDITAGYRSVELMKQYVARTMNAQCIGGLGGFGGLFELDCTDMPHPVLISGTDGVGTKLRIANLMDKHDTVGIDCVAMCVNDVICAGAKPLVFLDYIACGKNVPERIADLVKGVAEGCVQAGAALVGGETAEMPGFYPEDEYDLAGFTVGAVDKSKILDNSSMQPGDVILALPSSGVHSNGFSLVRKIFDLENDPAVLKTTPAELGGRTLGEALLEPTKIYVKPVLAVLEKIHVRGISHITGGGFYENIPRSLKAGCCARIRKEDVKTPGLFALMQRVGNIPERDMFNTFNMGVGMVLTVPAAEADEALAILHANGEPDAYVLGVIAQGEGVELC